MFKFKSYNVKRASEKNEKQQPSSSTATTKATAAATATLKKPSSKEKKKPSPQEIKAVNNITSPVYSKKNVTEWHKNKTYLAKKETKKVVIPSPHKKLERK